MAAQVPPVTLEPGLIWKESFLWSTTALSIWDEQTFLYISPGKQPKDRGEVCKDKKKIWGMPGVPSERPARKLVSQGRDSACSVWGLILLRAGSSWE